MSDSKFRLKEKWIIGITGASGILYAISLLRNLVLLNSYRSHQLEISIIITKSAINILKLEAGFPYNAPGETLNADRKKIKRKILEFLIYGEIPQISRVGQEKNLKKKYNESITLYLDDQMTAPLASGSFITSGMVVLPCSMNSLAKINSGICDNLLTRAAEVTLKEGRKIILVPRETPLSENALINMLSLKRKGASILPASPGFYHNPQKIDHLLNFIIGKIFNLMDLPQKVLQEWKMPI